MRQGPEWSQSGGGPLAHVAGASVVPKQKRPLAHVAGASVVAKRKKPPRPRGGGPLGPKVSEAP